MSQKQLFMQKPLEDFIEYLEKMNVRSVDLLPDFTASIVSFSDPYSNLRGSEDIQKLYKVRFEVFPELYFRVSHHICDAQNDAAYIHWRGVYQKPARGFILRRVPEPSSFGGVMVLRFTEHRQIEAIEEYWAHASGFPHGQYQKAIKRI